MFRRLLVVLSVGVAACGPLTVEEEAAIASQEQNVTSTNPVILHWNVAQGLGVAASDGSSCAYTAGGSNCATNAWGGGTGAIVQKLQLMLDKYPNTIALTLNEAESCSPVSSYKTALGWADYYQVADSGIVARYGFVAGSKVGQQLTTCGDGYARPVLRGLVCNNAACTSSTQVFATHLGWTTTAQPNCTQAAEVATFMSGFSGAKLLLGDTNADPGSPRLAALSAASYVDAWPAFGLPGTSYDGNTGTWNNPAKNNGFQYPTRRIDQVWYRDTTRVLTVRTFNQDGTVGSCRPSDHIGLILELTP